MNTKPVHVAVAVIVNSQGKILIAKRSADQHQGGLWEFPGGKVEAGEPVIQALARELEEELGIQVAQARPLIQVPHHYTDKSVLLDVYKVTDFSGEAWGREGQPVQWVELSKLDSYSFPAANQAIVNACLLPESWFITPEHISLPKDYLEAIAQASQRGARGIMLRAHHLADTPFMALAALLQEYCQNQGLAFVVNRNCELANALKVSGLHLSAQELQRLGHRQQYTGRWLSASCHTQEEVDMAAAKGLDFIYLSPVAKTASHPGEAPLGWEAFAGITAACPIPVYALGGLSGKHIPQAQSLGAQGIAAISAWLEG